VTIYLRYLRLAYFASSIKPIEVSILKSTAWVVSQVSYLTIPKKQWNIYPCIFLIVFIFLNVFTSAYVLFRYKLYGQYTGQSNVGKTVTADTTADDINTRYITMLYFIVTTITGAGYGDVIPLYFNEYFITMVLLLFGVFLYGFVITKITLIVKRGFSAYSIWNEQIEDFDSFMIGIEKRKSRNQIREDKQDSKLGLKEFVPVLWNCKVTTLLSIKHDAIKVFSSTFFHQAEYETKAMLFGMYLELLSVKFSGVFKLLTEVLSFELFEVMEVKIWFKDQFVLRKKEKSDGLYLIVSGKVDLLYCEKTKNALFSLGEGGVFGDNITIGEEETMSTVVSSKELVVLHVSMEHFSRIIRTSPQISSNVKCFTIFKYIIYKIERDRFINIVEGVLRLISKRHKNHMAWKGKSRAAMRKLLDDLLYDCIDYLSYDFENDELMLRRVYRQVCHEVVEYTESKERLMLVASQVNEVAVDYEDVASENNCGLEVPEFIHQNVTEADKEQHTAEDCDNNELAEPRPIVPYVFRSKNSKRSNLIEITQKVNEKYSVQNGNGNLRSLLTAHFQEDQPVDGQKNTLDDLLLKGKVKNYIKNFMQKNERDTLFHVEMVKYLTSKNGEPEDALDRTVERPQNTEEAKQVIDSIDDESVESELFEATEYYEDSSMHFYDYSLIEHQIKVLEGRLNNIRRNYTTTVRRMLGNLADISTDMRKFSQDFYK